MCVSILWLAALWLLASSALAASKEEDLKAAYVYNFSKFSQWPKSAFADTREQLNLCYLKESSLGGSLNALSGNPANGRKIQVSEVTNSSTDATCHILYVGKENPQEYPKLNNILRDNPVLIIADEAKTQAWRFSINLKYDSNKIRFDVNLIEAERRHLELSSFLLKLAKNVKK